MSSDDPKVEKPQNNQNISESITEDSDSDNSIDSGNLVIKEEPEEDTKQNEKEVIETVFNTQEKKPNELSEDKNVAELETNLENNDIKDEVNSKDCPAPSTCEVNIFSVFNSKRTYIYYYINHKCEKEAKSGT